MNDEPFTLTNDAQPRPQTFQNAECRQKALFDGLDCCRGQTDLFEDEDDERS